MNVDAPIADKPARSPSQAPNERHARARAEFAARATELERKERRYSLVRLVLFLGGAMALGGGLYEQRLGVASLGAALLLAFGLVVVLHLRLVKLLHRTRLREEVHGRHLDRLSGKWRYFPLPETPPYPTLHPYAFDIDICGKGSLMQRIDVSHTVRGRELLAAYLGAAATTEEAKARQAAVRELAADEHFRVELEALALEDKSDEALDGKAFAAFAQLPSLFAARPFLKVLIFALPALTLGAFVLGELGLMAPRMWLLPLSAQVLLVMTAQKHVGRAFNLGSARQGVVEAFEQMLSLAEAKRFESPLLQSVHQRLRVGDAPPSVQMGRLRRWVSLGELRQQFLLWAAINPLTLWDLHVLRGMENWNAEVGSHAADWFEALGELEALSSLATLHALEPESTFPELADEGIPLRFEGVSHPLLSAGTRVANDVALQGEGSALIVTGSNMAGKSTLLRAVGVNVVLALAGGPVCASLAVVPPLRLRASMRAQDDLQEGASYFRAELNKLRSVVEDAEARPPILFLLDELLRGTNERARHVGAKAVLLHLLRRHGCGFVATHDVALAALADDPKLRIENVHFTDVMRDGEMAFDYRLRPGVVKTSNALRLLAMSGIDVPDEAAETF